MAKSKFQHLPLPFVAKGTAKIHGGGKTGPRTQAHKDNRQAHCDTISGQIKGATESVVQRLSQRPPEAPALPAGIPLVLEVDPGLPLDKLRQYFDFEIVLEDEDGYVIVATQDAELTKLQKMVDEFVGKVHGSATAASIYRVDDDPEQATRLQKILSETLFDTWSTIENHAVWIVDVGVECTGTQEIKKLPKRGVRDSDQDWAKKQRDWSDQRVSAYEQWDDLKETREEEVKSIVDGYGGEILQIVDGSAFDTAQLPDSFTIRLRLSGIGLRDFVLNYPYIFEVVEPDDIELPQGSDDEGNDGDEPVTTVLSPQADAPTVCVIDSGIQESHRLIQSAIDSENSHSYLPENPSVADEVSAGGHGTRVAGAVLFGERVPTEEAFQAEVWIQNARVLNADCSMPDGLLPAALLEAIVERFHVGGTHTRIFNQSINARTPCRLKHMSSWAAAIDLLSFVHDILVIQSAGNVSSRTLLPANPGIEEHLNAGRAYPDYLTELSFRVSNPAQSFQAITVGSIAYGAFKNEQWTSLATRLGDASAFSRSGLGIWGVTKPDVVEYGGDLLISNSGDTGTPTVGREQYPELVRSTLNGGPAFDRDQVGTSFAAPKVTRIAAALQRLLPNDPTLLYRGLIVHSARWPEWVYESADTFDRLLAMRMFGFGIPDIERATSSSPYRSTLISQGVQTICPNEAKVFQIPVPPELRQQGDNFDIQIQVTLSYAAQPRRTRRGRRRYLSTWLEWKTSNLREPLSSFRQRMFKDDDSSTASSTGTSIPWVIKDQKQYGIEGVSRSTGTVQKDWAVVKSNELPENFCVAVIGHKGWSQDPETEAKFSLVVSFESVTQELEIHEQLEVAVNELVVELEAEIEV